MTSAPYLFGSDLDNVAPKGTKLWILHLGDGIADEGWFLRGGGATTLSEPDKPAKRRITPVIAALIEHPTEGLLLFETGCGQNHPEKWGAPLNDIFGRINYKEEHELPNAIKKCGRDIKDVKAVLFGHLHLDHAGGLENFMGSDVPIWVHEKELKHAFFSIATQTDIGAYQRKDLTFDVNWKAFHGPVLEIAPGIILRHSPGHTPGLCIMQVNLPDSGTWIFTTDQYHVHENYDSSIPQGWLARDHDDWVASDQMIKALAKRTNANLVFGHCGVKLAEYQTAPHFYS